MDADRNQAIPPRNVTRLDNSTRNLRIERTGDFFRGQVSPKIRLAGKRLERAGFKPGHRVEVRLDQPGTMTLRFLDQSNLLHDESHS